MSRPDPTRITQYLQRIERGDSEAVDALLPHVYSDLKDIANALFRRQREGLTLQPTALVHEAYMRLAQPRDGAYEGLPHFMHVAARAMRQILADEARRRGRLKRGGDAAVLRITTLFEQGDAAKPDPGAFDTVDMIALDEALDQLQELSPVQARVVELRFFGGLTIQETAEAMGADPRTVTRNWSLARAWLRRAIDRHEEP